MFSQPLILFHTLVNEGWREDTSRVRSGGSRSAFWRRAPRRSYLWVVRQHGRPLYEPLKAVSSSCTEGIFPEFNDDLDMNDCLLLPNRLFWREAGGRPLLIRQTMGRGSMWETSTGSSVWGGGIVLQRYLEQELGRVALSGKRVIELGTGTGLGAITAASLGAGEVLATHRDPGL